MIRHPALATFAALALTAAQPAVAGEHTTFQPLWVVSATAAGRPACSSTALLNLPAGWTQGDAAVVLLTTTRLQDPLRDSLVAALLHERAAVLEMVSGPTVRCSAEGAEDSGAISSADPLADLLGALRALTRDAGAGLVVAIGYGPGTTAALDALGDDAVTRHLGIGAPRFAAGAAIGDGPARFVLGPVQRVHQRAPTRLSLLCEALGQVTAGLGAGNRSVAAKLSEECRDALSRPLQQADTRP